MRADRQDGVKGDKARIMERGLAALRAEAPARRAVSGRMLDMNNRLSLQEERTCVFVRGSLRIGSPVIMRKTGRMEQGEPVFVESRCV